MTSDSALPYVPVEEIAMNGLRVAFARGVPGAVKAILDIKGIEHIPLPQDPGGSSEIMKDWTGQTSAPVVMFNDDKARPHGSKMLAWAKQVRPEPRLIAAAERCGARRLMPALGLLLLGCRQSSVLPNFFDKKIRNRIN